MDTGIRSWLIVISAMTVLAVSTSDGEFPRTSAADRVNGKAVRMESQPVQRDALRVRTDAARNRVGGIFGPSAKAFVKQLLACSTRPAFAIASPRSSLARCAAFQRAT